LNDVERGRELSRLIKMQSKLKKAHPSFRARVDLRIEVLMAETAYRFLEVFGYEHPIVRALEKSSPDQLGPGTS
jgi:hypothetical protein